MWHASRTTTVDLETVSPPSSDYERTGKTTARPGVLGSASSSSRSDRTGCRDCDDRISVRSSGPSHRDHGFQCVLEETRPNAEPTPSQIVGGDV
ncbi:hypothetical protein [Halomontanus rarus]|uniref:hypothetical protein n=1 Tax=Halomontanus rarus TaxID=3034020 RepID=UPI00307CBF85